MNRIAALTFMAFLVSACGLNQTGTDHDNLPDTISENFRRVTVSSTGRVEVLADRVEVYNDGDFSVLNGADIVELDEKEQKVLEGKANYIKIHGNGDGNASGDISVKSYAENSSLEGDEMTWNDDERLLTGQGNIVVELNDGVKIKSDTFRGDIARETYLFMDKVEGLMEIKDE